MENEKFKQMFFDEAREYLQLLNEAMLGFENDSSSKEALADMFRAAHSLKGMSSTMGYAQLSKVTHYLESLFARLRSGEMQMTTVLSDLFFETADLLEKLLLQVDSPEQTAALTEEMLRKLDLQDAEGRGDKSVPAGEGAGRPLGKETQQELKSYPAGKGEYLLRVRLRPETQMKSVRVFMVLWEVESFCKVVDTLPSREDLDNERFGDEFSLVLSGEFSEELLVKAVEGIAEIEQAKVEPFIAGEREPAKREEDGLKTEREDLREATIRVEIAKLDSLVNLIGELVINRNRLLELGRGRLSEAVDEAIEHQDRLISALQSAIMELRMVPVKEIFNRFPRMIRDLNRERTDKEVYFQMSGEETELDRGVMHEIAEPLVHLLRNAVDHGIETCEERQRLDKEKRGFIKLKASREGSRVVISVEDDGKGLDPVVIGEAAVRKGLVRADELAGMSDQERLNLIFAAGFSTMGSATAVSGRGVGMDIVSQKIESMHGKVGIETEVNKGTIFRLYLPLTLAIIKAQMVKEASQIYVIPLENIRENIYPGDYTIKSIREGRVLTMRDEVIPLISLRESLGYESPLFKESNPAIIVEEGGRKAALIVDSLLEQQEVVIKSLDALFQNIKGIAGATIMGDGRVAPIVDVAGLLE